MVEYVNKAPHKMDVNVCLEQFERRQLHQSYLHHPVLELLCSFHSKINVLNEASLTGNA